MKNICIVPARSGSKGVPGKNLMKVGSRSLLVRSIEHARQLGAGFETIVSVDSLELLREVLSTLNPKSAEGDKIYKNLQFDNRVVNLNEISIHLREANLATDSSTLMELLQSIKNELPQAANRSWVVFQPTSPFRSYNDFERIRDWERNNHMSGTGLVSVTEVTGFHPARMYRLDDGHLQPLKEFRQFETVRRQLLPKLFIRDGAIYGMNDEQIDCAMQVSQASEYVIREFPYSINIDSEVDLRIARQFPDL